MTDVKDLYKYPEAVDAYGFDWMNLLSSVGAALLGASTLPFLWNAWRSWRHGEPAGDDPWGGHTLEWTTETVEVTSESPLLDAAVEGGA